LGIVTIVQIGKHLARQKVSLTSASEMGEMIRGEGKMMALRVVWTDDGM
jgi:hypothetical protein